MDNNFSAYVVKVESNTIKESIDYLKYNGYQNIKHIFDCYFYCSKIGETMDDIKVIDKETFDKILAENREVTWLIRAYVDEDSVKAASILKENGYENARCIFANYFVCDKIGNSLDNVFVVDTYSSTGIYSASSFEKTKKVLDEVMDVVYDARAGVDVDFEDDNMNDICDEVAELSNLEG